LLGYILSYLPEEFAWIYPFISARRICLDISFHICQKNLLGYILSNPPEKFVWIMTAADGAKQNIQPTCGAALQAKSALYILP